MKKTITFTAICILVCIALSSCRSNMYVTKRHYSNGYYVSHSKGRATIIPTEKATETVVIKPRASLYSIENPANPVTPNAYTAHETPVATNSIYAPKKTIYQTVFPKNMKQRVNAKTGIITPVKQQTSVSSSTKKLVDDSERRGLSLFWLVILIILILWAIGFLAGGFGLGGLINLLLLVALILLILWLFRII